MSDSKLVSYTKISPHKSKRTGKISKITIHHMAGNLTVEACGNVFNGKRSASANYGIGTDGRIALYVPEDYRAYTSSNRANDNIAVTIEVANDGGSKTNWHVSDKALESLIKLCVDICKRNDIEKLNYTGTRKGNLTRHNMFAATACPGKYLQSKFSYIAEEVNKQLAPPADQANKELSAEEQGGKFPYEVKITAKVLNVRTGAGTTYKIATTVKKNGVYTIVDEKKNGSTTWGKLKSGAGWISLGYAKKC